MQGMYVTDHVRFSIPAEEALSRLPVVEGDVHFVVARRQRADVDFTAEGDDEARADAGIALGDALACARVEDMDGEGMAVEERFVITAQAGPE